MPNIENEHVKEKDERPFFLRVFASEQIELTELPRTIEQKFESAWGPKSAGGKRVDDKGREN